MKLHEKIYRCRKKLGMSQVDLADALGVSRQSVSKWETGESNPEISKLPQLAELFGVTADWLLSEDDIPETEEYDNARDTGSAAAWPAWVEHLPGSLGKLIKRFGWIFGLRMAIGGALIAVMGIVARVMFRSTIFGSYTAGPIDPFSGFQNSSWGTASTFTGFIIILGAAAMIAGIILAVFLKKWGERNK